MGDGVNRLTAQIRQRYEMMGDFAIPTDRGGRCDVAQIRSALDSARVEVERGRMTAADGEQVLRAASEVMLQSNGADAASISAAMEGLREAIRAAEARATRSGDRLESAPARANSGTGGAAGTQTPRQALRASLQSFPIPPGSTPESIAQDVRQALFSNNATSERTLAGLARLPIYELDSVLQRRFGGAAPAVRQEIFDAVRTRYRAALGERVTEQLSRTARELARFDDRDAQRLARGAARGDAACRELIRRLCGDDAERMLTLADASPGYPAAADEFRRAITARAHEAAETIRETLPRFSPAHVMLDRNGVALFDCDHARREVDRRMGVLPGSSVAELVLEDMRGARENERADRALQFIVGLAGGIAMTVVTGGLGMVAAGAIGTGTSALRAAGGLGIQHQRAVEANALAIAGAASGNVADAREAEFEHALGATAVGLAAGTAAGALGHAGHLPAVVSGMAEVGIEANADRIAHEHLAGDH